MRRLFTGEGVNRQGAHYTVENARLYTVPDEPVPIDISGFGPKATAPAARVGDGYITMMPRREMVTGYRGGGGTGPVSGGTKVCYGTDRDECVRTEHGLWYNMLLDQHAAAPRAFADAGFDRVYVNQIGQDQRGFFDFHRAKVLPRLDRD